MTNLDSMLKRRDITLSTKVCLVKALVFPVVMYGCESWTIKKAERRRIDASELWCWRRLLESPWDCKDIQPVHPKGNQSWVFIGRTDVEAVTLVLWPPDVKGWLIWKDPHAGKDWGWEEKGTTQDEMVGWHHRLDGHEFGWTPGVGDGQKGLACAVHGVARTWTRLSDWTELSAVSSTQWAAINGWLTWLMNGCFRSGEASALEQQSSPKMWCRTGTQVHHSCFRMDKYEFWDQDQCFWHEGWDRLGDAAWSVSSLAALFYMYKVKGKNLAVGRPGCCFRRP